jgi:hypothetical protein
MDGNSDYLIPNVVAIGIEMQVLQVIGIKNKYSRI